MKKLSYILGISIVCLLAIWGIDCSYSWGIRHNLNHKVSYLQQEGIDAEIVFHGPCEPLWMIDPQQIDAITGVKSYNLALAHSDFADNYIHLIQYLKFNRAPRLLLLYVTPESFDLRYNTFNTYRFTEMEASSEIDEVIAEMDSNYALVRNLPLLRHSWYGNQTNFLAFQGFKHWLSDKPEPLYPNGYVPPIHRSWDYYLDDFIDMYPAGTRFTYNLTREKYLRKIIELCQQKDIQILLYESPVLKEALPYQLNRNDFLDKTHQIAQEYNTQYLVFDTLSISNSRDYFFSTLNTTIEGSRIFNDVLGNYIKSQLPQQ